MIMGVLDVAKDDLPEESKCFLCHFCIIEMR